MLKNILSVPIGVIIGTMTVFLVQRLNAMIHVPPEGLDPADKEVFAAYIGSLPTLAFLLIISSFVLGALIGAFITSKMAETQKFNLGIFTGFILFVSTFTALTIIPNPLWVVLTGILLTLISLYFGAKWGAGGRPDYDL